MPTRQKVEKKRGSFSAHNVGLSSPFFDFICKLGAVILILVINPIYIGFIGPAQAQAAVPRILSYEGRLTDSSGNLLGGTGTSFFFKFSIWDSPTSTPITGSRVWPTGLPGISSNMVVNGVFNVNIGDTAAGYPDVLNYDFSNKDVFLQVEVATSSGGTYEVLSPRIRIGASSFAINAEAIPGIIASSGIATLATTTISSLSVSGTSTFTGLTAMQLVNFSSATGTTLGLSGSGTALQVTVGLTSLQGMNFTNATGTSLTLDGAGTALNVANNATFGSLVSTGSSTITDFNFSVATGTSANIGTLTLNNSLGVTSGGSGASSFSRGILIASGTNALASLTGFADGMVLMVSSTAPLGYSFEVASSSGGSGITSLNGLISTNQTFSTSTSYIGSFNIKSAGSSHTFNFPGRINDINNLATSTGSLITGNGTSWASLLVGTNGYVLTASSSATNGISWEPAATTGITSLNGSTSSTQTFATIGNISVTTVNGQHTFQVTTPTTTISVNGTSINGNVFTFTTSTNASGLTISGNAGTVTWTLATSSGSTNGFLSSSDWLNFASKATSSVTISAGVGLAGGGDLTQNRTIYLASTFATSGLSGLQIASSSGNSWTWSLATSTASQSGFLSASDFLNFSNKQGVTTTIASGGTTITGPAFTLATTTNYNGGFNIQGVTFNFPGRINDINNQATTTGNLLFANGTTWTTISSSSFVNSINGVSGGLTGLNIYNTTTSINGLTGAITGANLFNTTTTLSGSTYLSVTNGGVGATTINLNITPVSSTRQIIAGSGLLGGGDLSVDRTIYFGGTFGTSTNLSGLSIASSSGNSWVFTLATSSATTNGFLTASDFLNFSNKQGVTTTISAGGTTVTGPAFTLATSSNLSGLSINGTTFTLATSSGSTNGFLSSSDWLNFASKASSSITITAGSGLLGGGDLTSNRTLYWNANVATGTIAGLNFTNATGTNINVSQIVATASSTIVGLNFTNATGTNAVFTGVASSTNFQSGGLAFGNATGTNLFVSGVASSTSFQTPGLQFGTATGSTIFATNASSTNLSGANFNFNIGIGTTLFVTTVSSTNFQATNATTSVFFSATASSTNFQAGGLAFGNATGTNLFVSGVASSTSFQTGALQFNNATGTNLRIAQLVSTGSSTITGLNFVNATGTNIQWVNATSSGNTFVNNLTVQGTCTNCGAGGSPGAPSNSIQYNNNGVFAGDANLTWSSSTQNLTVASATITMATTTNLWFGNATGSLAFFTTASSTNFQTGGFQFNNATGTNLFISGVASSTSFQTGALQFNNATGTNLKAALALFTTASSTNFQAGNIQFQDATGTNIKTTQLNVGSLSGLLRASNGLVSAAASSEYVSSTIAGSHIVLSGSSGAVTISVNDSWATGTISGLTFTNATGTNINVSQIVATGSSTIVGLNYSDATGTNERVSQIVATASSTIQGLNFSNATGTNLNFTMATGTNLFFGNATGTTLTLQKFAGTSGCASFTSSGAFTTSTCLSSAVTTLNGLSGAITANIYNTTTSINGLTGSITANIFNTTTTITAGTHITTNGSTGAVTIAVNDSWATGTISGLTFTNATGTNLALVGLTNGSVLFATSSGLISQDNSNFYWDNTNHRLGIGTTNPLAQLHVGPGTDAPYMGTSPLFVTNAGSTSISVRDSANHVEGVLYSNITGVQIGAATNHSLSFMTNFTTHMTIATSGNVGIGTTTPQYTLTDIGSLFVSGNSTIVGLNFTNATGTNAVFTGVASSTAFQTGALQFNNATGTNLQASLGFFTTASSTNFQAGNIQFQDATGTNIKTNQLSVDSLSGLLRASNGIVGTAASSEYVSSTIAGSHIVVSGSSGAVTISVNDSWATGTISGLTFTNATGTNLNVSQIVATGSSTISALNFFNATGTNIQWVNATSSGNTFLNNLTVQGTCTGCGAGGTPAAPNKSVQFNNNGVFGGDANFTWTSSTNQLFINSTSTSALVIVASTTPENDIISISNATSTGVTTQGTNAMQITYYGGTTTAAIDNGALRINLIPGASNNSSANTWTALRINMAPTTTSTSAMIGLKFDDIAGGAGGLGTETAIQFGLGLDASLRWLNTTSTLVIPNSTGTIWRINNGSTTLLQLRQINGGNTSPFGGILSADAFESKTSYFGEEFSLGGRGTCASGAAGVASSSPSSRGSIGFPGLACTQYSGELTWASQLVSIGSSTASVSSPKTVANGVERFAATTTAYAAQGAASLEFLGGGATGTIATPFAAGNRPTVTMKVTAYDVISATTTYMLGLGDKTTSTLGVGANTATVAPNNGIYFSNCTTAIGSGCGATWNGVVRSAGGVFSTVSCTGNAYLQSTTTAYLKIEVRANNDVHFYVDNNVANGVQETECGTGVSTNIPTTALSVMLENGITAVAAAFGNQMDVDYFRVWQDDSNTPAFSSQTTIPETTTTPILADFGTGSTLGQMFQTSGGVEDNELVSLDVLGATSTVHRSDTPYDPYMVGIAVSDGGLSMDNGTIYGGKRVVTAGRTYVKVSTENGNIEPGDYLTSSGEPGVAMKATKGGFVIGQALSAYSDSAIGQVLIIIRPSSYTGPSLLSLLPKDFTVTSGNDFSKAILGKLLQNSSSTAQSEIFTDRLAAAVEIIAPQITAQGLTIDHIASVNDAINFQNDVVFFGRPYFNQDTAGFALVKQGDKSVDVTFNQEYLEQPIVNTTISMENTGSEDTIFASSLQYIVTKKSTKGFTILLNKPAPVDINFSWTAFAVKNARIFTSNAASTTPVADTTSNPPAITDTSSTPPADTSTSTPPAADTSSTTTSTSNPPVDTSTTIVPPPPVDTSFTPPSTSSTP